MPDLRLDRPFAFDRGIDRVTHESGDQPDLPGLPGDSRLAPSEMPQPAQLDRLLAMPNLDDYMQSALHPELGNKDLLVPAQFRHALEAAGRMLRDTAQAQPDEARVLNRAARLLSEESDLRDLVQMYRSVLLQG
jgi:type III secretion protein X